MISLALSRHLEERLGESQGNTFRILRTTPVTGGCINHAHRLETTTGNYFVKYNSSTRFPGMFEAEAKGLKILAETKTVRVPEIILTGDVSGFSYIVLEFLESAEQKENYWENAGIQLAQLHRSTSENFGLDHDNFIGSIPQSNKQHNDWIEFFLKERILPLGGTLVSPYISKLEKVLQERIPVEKPALLHGDLWNGNIICGPQGTACLLDPAVYYGHREMDLAMTRLFSGFSKEFYKSYEATFPLAEGFEERIDLYNLYPLLVHLKIFGDPYQDQVMSILKKL